MRDYVERAKDFIEQIFPYLEDNMDLSHIDDAIDAFNAEYDRKVMYRHGLSRIALITSDYVVKFDYDPDEIESIGGCQNEVALYYDAKQEGFEYLLAEITPFSFHDREFYIMPRIYGIGSGRYYAEHYMNPAEQSFCRKHRITDLHSNNYGFRRGHVCLIDYACHLSYESEYDDYYENRSSEW